MRVAIDMDEVLADTHAAVRALYRRRGHDWGNADLRGRRIHDLAPPEDAAEVIRILDEGHVFGTLDVVDGAVDAVRALADRHEVFVATAAMEHPGSFTPKFHWLRRHFPFLDPLNFVFCGDKGVIAADVLIDDSPRHFDRFAGTGVVFSAPHNAAHEGHPRLRRWADAPELIARLGARAA